MILLAGAWGFSGDAAQAELRPDQLVILAMAKSEGSRQVAEHYAQARGVPRERILYLEGEPGRDLSRAEYEKDFRPAIRRFLAEKQLAESTRCLVTTFDVPLKIGHAERTPMVERRLQFLNGQKDRLRRQIGEAADALNGQFQPQNAAALPPVPRDAPLPEFARQIMQALQGARERLGQQPVAVQQQHGPRLDQLALTLGGKAVLLQTAQAASLQPGAALEAMRQVDVTRGTLDGLRMAGNILGWMPEQPFRDAALMDVAQELQGIIGALAVVEEQLTILARGETYGSLDNELALLHYPDETPLTFWLSNPLSFRIQTPLELYSFLPLMVARLDGPTVELAKGLVDAAIETEKTGLSGKFYIDARGIAVDPKQRQPGGYADYDESLRELAALVKEHTALEVVLDNEGALFSPGSCPEAALYCGWYSLSNYVDAFTWQRGAVAYHIASGEAATLRDPNSNVWCKRMIEKGVAATTGPTFEPYLAAFPRPDEFFPLVLSGQYTLGECYWRTLPHVSWVMVYVGDPLYNPYAGRAALDPTKLPTEKQRLFLERRPWQPTLTP